MATHHAVATVSLKQLAVIEAPTIASTEDEVRIRVHWVASTPLDLHQTDGGLLVTYPQVLGGGVASTVIEVGSEAKRLRKEKGHQEFVTAPEWLFGKIPDGSSMQETVTLPNNLVTVFHSLTLSNYIPHNVKDPILVWGGASSVGQYAVQVLRYYGYNNIFVTTSTKHHKLLMSHGAAKAFHYCDEDVVAAILEAATEAQGDGIMTPVPLTLDCIGSLKGSMKPISRIAKSGTRAAVLLPVVVREGRETDGPVYGMDVQECVTWAEGVEARGVRTHSYLENDFFKYHLQPDIMPTMLKEGIVSPNKQRIIEGGSLLERAERALIELRRKRGQW
ncbi:GroES-like protein [Delitschia confertaspora ATCC 74209]|uniref:GroES-like protein n=1 Tax=Delitschia confertaspora ATCC 74209 TaxID=1513339 RepID=A0A9P4JFY4_9PLEO|nr:GroES-like protein [Delitschia confertaspora ATCC 74209]